MLKVERKDYLKDILEQQYTFSKWFRKYWFNSIEEKLDYSFQNAYNIIEESIECSRNCDSRKYWKLNHNNDGWLSYVRLLEEIIDIVKFTLNWIFDLTVEKENVINKSWEIWTTHQRIREFFWISDFEWDELTRIFEICYNDLLETDLIVPSINEKVKEENTLYTVRKIITLASKIEETDYNEIRKDLTFQKWKENIEKNLEIQLKILKECLNLWVYWNIDEDDIEEFNKAADNFFEHFEKKSIKNIKRQKRGTEEQINHWNEE